MFGAVSYSFRLNLRVMKFIGLYPSTKYNGVHRLYAYVIFFFAMIPTTVLGSLHFLFSEDLASVDSDFILVSMIFYTFKLLPFVRNRNKIKECIEYFDDPVYVARTKYHKEILDDCVTTCRRNSHVFFVGCIGGLLALLGEPFLEQNGLQLPLNVWIPPIIKETSLYYLIHFSLVLGLVYVALACGTIDPLIGGLCHHAAAQLQMLKKNFQHLDEDATIKSETVYEQIKQYARRYQEIVIFVSEYEECFSPVVFSQFTGSVLVIGLCCFQISTMTPPDLNFFILSSRLCLISFQVFFYCYYGTLLMEENHTFSTAIYMSRWYDYGLESKKALILIMERSKKPMVVTAGKLLDLSLDTFTLILKRSYSLLAVLRNY